jgi:hypothetical protein
MNIKNILKNYKIENNISPSNINNISKNYNDKYIDYDCNNDNPDKEMIKLNMDFFENENENQIGINENRLINEKIGENNKFYNDYLEKRKFLIKENEDIFKNSKSEIRKSISRSIDNNNKININYYNYNNINKKDHYKNTELNIYNNRLDKNENLGEENHLNFKFKSKSRDISNDEKKDYSQKFNEIQMKLNNKHLLKKQNKNFLISTSNKKSPEINFNQKININENDNDNNNYNNIILNNDKKNLYNYIQKTTKNINCYYNLNSLSSCSNYQNQIKDKDKDDYNDDDKDYQKISFSYKKSNFRNREISASSLSRRNKNYCNENKNDNYIDKINNSNKKININSFKINYSIIKNNLCKKDEYENNNKNIIENPKDIYHGGIINSSKKEEGLNNRKLSENIEYVSFKYIDTNNPNNEAKYIIKNSDKIQRNIFENINTDYNNLSYSKECKTPRVNKNDFNNNNFDYIENVSVKYEKFLEIFKSPENFKMNFLKEKFGIFKFNILIDFFEKSKNIEEDLNDDKQLKNILGDEFKLAKSFLKNIYKDIH